MNTSNLASSNCSSLINNPNIFVPSNEGQTIGGKDGDGGNPIKKQKKKAEAWVYFTDIFSDHGIKRAICNYCGENYSISGGGTGRLVRHSSKCYEKHNSGNDPRQTHLSLVPASD